MNDRKFEMIAEIVRNILSSTGGGEAAEEQIVNSLIKQGYDLDEISEAFEWLESFSDNLQILEPAEHPPLSETEAPPVLRMMNIRESSKFTEEGLRLFYNWLQAGLIEAEEREMILRSALDEKDESVDSLRLVALARRSARSSSALSLYLMEADHGSTGPH